MPRPTAAPPHPSILQDLPFALARASMSFRRFNDQTLRDHGLTRLAPGAASALHAAEELGDCAVSRLAERTHLPNGTLSGLLDTLESDGYIRRLRNPDDGRSWIVQLTEAGTELCAKLRLRHRRVMEIFGESLSTEEMAELSRLLERAARRMRDYEP